MYDVKRLILDDLYRILDDEKPMFDKTEIKEIDVKALKWIYNYYKENITRTYHSELINFQFKKGADTELIILEKENGEVFRIIWIAERPLDILGAITGRIPLKVDSRIDKNYKVNDLTKMRAELLSNGLVLFIQEDKSHIIPFVNIRRDRLKKLHGKQELFELFYILTNAKDAKSDKKIIYDIERMNFLKTKDELRNDNLLSSLTGMKKRQRR